MIIPCHLIRWKLDSCLDQKNDLMHLDRWKTSKHAHHVIKTTLCNTMKLLTRGFTDYFSTENLPMQKIRKYLLLLLIYSFKLHLTMSVCLVTCTYSQKCFLSSLTFALNL